METLKKQFIASQVSFSETKQSEIYQSVRMLMFQAPAANLNGCAVTEAFIDDIINNASDYVCIPLCADVQRIKKGDLGNLGHMYDAQTGTFGSQQIGSFYSFEKQLTPNGCALIGQARVMKRNKQVCEALVELFEQGALSFSFEVTAGDYIRQDDGTILIDASENNYLEGMAVVSNPAYVNARALQFVAEAEQGKENNMSTETNTEVMTSEVEVANFIHVHHEPEAKLQEKQAEAKAAEEAVEAKAEEVEAKTEAKTQAKKTKKVAEETEEVVAEEVNAETEQTVEETAAVCEDPEDCEEDVEEDAACKKKAEEENAECKKKAEDVEEDASCKKKAEDVEEDAACKKKAEDSEADAEQEDAACKKRAEALPEVGEEILKNIHAEMEVLRAQIAALRAELNKPVVEVAEAHPLLNPFVMEVNTNKTWSLVSSVYETENESSGEWTLV